MFHFSMEDSYLNDTQNFIFRDKIQIIFMSNFGVLFKIYILN